MSTKTQARPLFAATLRPHRSLGRRGYRYVVALACLITTVPVVIFSSLGAWPIVGFLGLDVVAVIWALSASMRAGEHYEQVTLWPDELELKRVSSAGKGELQRFNPREVKLVIDRDYNERVTALHLRSRDNSQTFGTFLSADEKSSFAKAFGSALKKSRR